MDKKELRRMMLKKRDQTSTEIKTKNDDKILEEMLKLKEYRDAVTVMCFVSYKSEVDTHTLIKESLRRGKRIIVPIVDNEKKILILSELRSFDELARGSYGILEPKTEYVRAVDPKTVDLCIVPGAVFDKRGYRIGYGGGFYDKLIPLFKNDALKVGVAYDFQYVDEVPEDEYDQKLNMLVTEKNIYKFK